MTTTVIYIAPASGERHYPQARIYRAEFDGSINSAGIRAHYRNHPERYTEVGLMNHRGKLVCFDGTPQQREDLTNDQPLMAGLVYTYDDEPAAANPQ
jgi:hypothetical protein